MGCVGTRELGMEEKCIVNSERGLGFYNVKAEELDAAFRKYNSNGYMTQSQLIHISNKFNIRILNYGNHMHIQSFFSSLKANESNYNLKDMLLIAIMLGKGSSETKAKLIYEIFDTEYSHQLTIQVVKKEILTRMVVHSSRTLPNLVCSEMAEPELEMKIHKFKSKFEDFVEIAISELALKLTVRGKIISEDTFVEVFSTYYNGELVNPSGIRKFLLSLRGKQKIKSSDRSTIESQLVPEEVEKLE